MIPIYQNRIMNPDVLSISEMINQNQISIDEIFSEAPRTF
jgi:hypothetical protein